MALPALRAAAPVHRWVQQMPGGTTVCSTGSADGDFADPDPDARASRRAAVADRPWTALRQVHGWTVARVRVAGDGVGVEADAAVSASGPVALAVLTADCAPVALASPEGVIGIAHAGWKGLLGGVLASTVDAMAGLGATRVHAAIGPCIEAACYSFSADDLDRAAAIGGEELRGRDRTGGAALDLRAGVRAALRRAGATIDHEAAACTACSGGHWSWRARRDTQRHATVIWRR